MTRLTAIVFDLDQTLFDRQLAFDHWISDLTLSNSDQSRLRLLDQNGYGNRESFFAAFESMTCREMDHPKFVRSLLRFIHPDRSLIRCLKRLRAVYSMAILTNGGVWTQHAKIQALRLHEVFPLERIFVSEEIGYAKPDPDAFEFVSIALGVPANECLYFGDSSQTDVIAARSAGWRARRVRGPSELIQLLVRLQEVVGC